MRGASLTKVVVPLPEQISALHKSVRGSNPDASLCWLTRMLDGGCDPLYVARRLVRMAIEDIGLADPRAWRVTLDACDTFERLWLHPKANWRWHRRCYIWRLPQKQWGYSMALKAARKFVSKDKSGRCRCICAMRPPN